MSELKIGIISDTHDLLRPEAVSALAGVGRILHAGDIGPEEILESLGRIAPVIAVRGNTDLDGWAGKLHRTEIVAAGSQNILIIHNLEDLDMDPTAAGIGIIVHGHTHRPSVEVKRGILYINPGSAGPRRFTLPVSVAILDIGGPSPKAEIIRL